jgi:hypothetical protein
MRQVDGVVMAPAGASTTTHAQGGNTRVSARFARAAENDGLGYRSRGSASLESRADSDVPYDEIRGGLLLFRFGRTVVHSAHQRGQLTSNEDVIHPANSLQFVEATRVGM